MEPPGYGRGLYSRGASESPYLIPLVLLQKVLELETKARRTETQDLTRVEERKASF